MPNSLRFSLTFLRKEQIAKDTIAFYFDRTKTKFDFVAGQYIRMNLQMENPDDRGQSRYFSLASSPLDKKEIRIITKMGNTSFKKQMFNFKHGESIDFLGPFGDFKIDEASPIQHVLLSHGIGITPYISMVEYATEKHLSVHITLIASFETPEEIILRKELDVMTDYNNHFTFIPTITKSEKLENSWTGSRGKINASLLTKHIENLQNCIYYIVGSESVVVELTGVLEELEIDEDKIIFESFTGY